MYRFSNFIHIIAECGPTRAINRRRSIAGLLLCAAVSSPAFAIDAPPLSPDQVTPAIAPSSISATIQIGMAALDRAVERRVPRRIASFNDRVTECWHRRILGREVDVDCVYSGYVERVGGVPLRAEGGRITAATPLFGTVSAQGTGRFTSRLRGTAEGQLTVFASARPRLRPDWSVSLDISEGFRWTEPPTLTILGFRINLEKYVEPRIRAQLGRLKGDFEAKLKTLDIRGKAERAWQQAFATVPIMDTPAIWLRTTPQSMAFSGTRVRRDMLEGSIAMTGTAETGIGTAPPPPSPTPLPRFSSDVEEPGQFSMIVPVTISYDLIRQQLSDLIAARAQGAGLKLDDVSVYPSAGKLVAALRLSAGEAGKERAKAYFTATPQVDADAQTMQLANPALVADPALEGQLASFLNDPALIQTLGQDLRVALPAGQQAIIASANARLTRPLADGFRSEGHLTSAGLSRILLLSDGVRLDLRANGELRILYGL